MRNEWARRGPRIPFCALLFALFTPAVPASYPRHSRESGNPQRADSFLTTLSSLLAAPAGLISHFSLFSHLTPLFILIYLPPA